MSSPFVVPLTVNPMGYCHRPEFENYAKMKASPPVFRDKMNIRGKDTIEKEKKELRSDLSSPFVVP